MDCVVEKPECKDTAAEGNDAIGPSQRPVDDAKMRVPLNEGSDRMLSRNEGDRAEECRRKQQTHLRNQKTPYPRQSFGQEFKGKVPTFPENLGKGQYGQRRHQIKLRNLKLKLHWVPKQRPHDDIEVYQAGHEHQAEAPCEMQGVLNFAKYFSDDIQPILPAVDRRLF